MSEHTPGPWRADTYSVRMGEFQIVAREWEHGCMIVCSHPRDVERAEECEANARLIAAAPELLEALQKADDALSNCGKFHDDEPRLSIRAAIAKATGETL